jgi:hypothetical protein
MALKGITGKEYQVGQRPGQAVPGLDVLTKELLRLQGADRRPGPGKHVLEVGKTYWFRFSGEKGATQKGKVIEAPADNWVKVEVPWAGKTTTSWINLKYVVAIYLDPEQK